MSPGFEDLFTHSLADAARFERMRANAPDDRPTLADLAEWDDADGDDEPEDAEEWR